MTFQNLFSQAKSMGKYLKRNLSWISNRLPYIFLAIVSDRCEITQRGRLKKRFEVWCELSGLCDIFLRLLITIFFIDLVFETFLGNTFEARLLPLLIALRGSSRCWSKAYCAFCRI